MAWRLISEFIQKCAILRTLVSALIEREKYLA